MRKKNTSTESQANKTHLTDEEVRIFRRHVRTFYRTHQRTLPWRETHDPYKIWVSEIMLQQTQVDRVLPKYHTFVQTFPNVDTLAAASLQEVLALWVGLGYNRRAQHLHKAATILMREYKSTFPHTAHELEQLPGIGPYTARAIATFAYGTRGVFIETNIRTVYIHHFFAGQHNVHDNHIYPLIEATLPTSRIKEWYWALMDYGTHLKKTVGNASRQSTHHTMQSRFKGSVREVRGAIVRILSAGARTRTELERAVTKTDVAHKHFDRALAALTTEGMLTEQDEYITLN